MKYLIDLDSLLNCLDALIEGKINGNEYAYMQNIKAFITKFPKYKVKENINIEIKNDIEIIN